MVNLPEVGRDMLSSVKYGDILSIRKNSATLRLKIPEGVIIKCFEPEMVVSSDAIARITQGDPFLCDPTYADQNKRYYFTKTAVVSLQSGLLQTEENFAPELMGVFEPEKKVYLKEVHAPTYQEYMSTENNRKKKTEELVDALVQLHSIFGRNFEGLYLGIKWRGKNTFGLRPRNFSEELQKMRNYFEVILYRTSDEFTQYRISKHIRPNKQVNPITYRHAVRKAINEYLSEKGIDLNSIVRAFAEDYWNVVYGLESSAEKSPKLPEKNELGLLKRSYQSGLINIIHGDFFPQNVFKLPKEYPAKVKICDTVDMRIDSRSIDLVSALYNLDTNPHTVEEEVRNLELIKNYVNGVAAEEGIKLDLGNFIAITQITRLRQAIRLFAVDCRLTLPQMETYCPKISLTKSDITTTDQQGEEKFLETMFIDTFQKFTDYVLGEGWGSLYALPNAKILRRQVLAVNKFFIDSGIVTKLTQRSKRRGKLEEILHSNNEPRPD